MTGPNYATAKSSEITCSVWLCDNELIVWYPLIDTLQESDCEYMNNVIEEIIEESEHYEALGAPRIVFYPQRVSVGLEPSCGAPEAPESPRRGKKQKTLFAPPAATAPPEEYEISEELKDKLTHRVWAAHNGWSFDSHVWLAKMPKDFQPWETFDTLPMFRRVGLPAGLDATGKYLYKLGKHEGYRTMRLLMRPSKRGRNRGQFIPHTAENMPLVVAYCALDVLLQARVWKEEVAPYVWQPAWENKNLYMDRIINDFGVRIDTELCAAMVRLELRLREQKGQSVEELVSANILGDKDGRGFLRSTKKVHEWLESQNIELPDLRRDTVEDFLSENEVSEQVELVLLARLGESTITTAKVKRATAAMNDQELVRWALAFNSAHTGRWGGRVFQPHNLPRGHKLLDWEKCINWIRYGDEEILEYMLNQIKVQPNEFLIRNDPPTLKDVLSASIRPMIIPRAGHVFLIVDLASVEARGICYLGDDEEGLEIYRRHLDPYKNLASKLFNADYDAITKFQRFIGKTGELGCGYGMGEGGCEKFLEGYNLNVHKLYEIGVTPGLIVKTFRDLHPKLAGEPTGDLYEGKAIRKGGLWKNLSYVIERTVNDRGGSRITKRSCGKCLFWKYNGHMFIELPSGRRLIYRNVRMGKKVPSWGGDPVDTVVFDSYKNGRMVTTGTYGGKISENITQSFTRDVLSYNMLRILEQIGIHPTFHVHDEGAWEVPIKQAELRLDSVMRILSTPPPWCQDFPLKCSGFISPRYCKEKPKGSEELEYYLGERL